MHGYSGPLKVSYGGMFTNVGKDFLDVAAKFDKNRELTDDPNRIYTSNAYGVRFSDIRGNHIFTDSMIVVCSVCRSRLSILVGSNDGVLTDYARWIDGETGKRSDVAHHYLYNHTKTTGLEILTGSLVKRVIFEYVLLIRGMFLNYTNPPQRETCCWRRVRSEPRLPA